MFPNLEAEQARNGHTNEDVAKKLGILRQTYEHKKKFGSFKLKEISVLVNWYGVGFEYLFAYNESAS